MKKPVGPIECRCNFAYNIKRIRNSLHFSQPKFAKMLGVSTRQEQNWEAGISLPTMLTAIKMVNILGKTFEPISIDRLLFKKLNLIF